MTGAATAPSEGCTLDHVGVCARSFADLLPLFAGELAGRWANGGLAPGFRTSQLAFDGGTVELMEPHEPEVDDFLLRYLDRRGPGPHHLTFEVDDLAADAARVQAAGHRVVVDRIEVPTAGQRDVLLAPQDCQGVLVQLVQRPGPHYDMRHEALPEPRVDRPSRLDHIALATADPAASLALLEGLLGGRRVGSSGESGPSWIDLAWPGDRRVRLLWATGPDDPVARWLDGRPGGFHHLAFTTDDPAAVAGARPAPDGYEVPPDPRTGTRIVLGARA
ncbi:MAG: VOC family protein [Acidimicrobiia bacterium]